MAAASNEFINQSRLKKKELIFVIKGFGVKRAFAAVRLINSRINFHNGLFMIFQLAVLLIREFLSL
jgi:hypothetical protein